MTYRLGQYIPGVEIGTAAAAKAFSYIQSKLGEFSKLGGKLHARQMEAAAIARVLRDKGRDDSEAMQHVRGFAQLKLEWADEKAKLDNLVGNVPGLGAIPAFALIAYGTVAISLAAAMALIFRKSNAAEKALDAFKAGQLTPEELRDVLREVPEAERGLFAGLKGAMTPLIIGVAAITLLPLLFKPTRQTW